MKVQPKPIQHVRKLLNDNSNGNSRVSSTGSTMHMNDSGSNLRLMDNVDGIKQQLSSQSQSKSRISQNSQTSQTSLVSNI